MVKYGWEICDDVQLHRGNIADMQFVERAEYQAIWNQLKAQLDGEVRQAEWLQAERNKSMKFKALLKEFGNESTDVFEQMLKGSWVDDHGHSVQMCAAMLRLKAVVLSTMRSEEHTS